ncbi:hypothetical protein SAMN02746065_13022 [Desulfocicer vacuolatum DSM 3385]|uniref:Uncharacterized protein n=1 Tax=Desulfocicer vacuolatum DSM 3385 TaxID=1121400 RepID=A0A1W2EET1_9BACT|nr:hypothetical protein [Desulfocicer vacuolatum]SMD08280.1 hypothetical protein SAMN02746065_13022 [Desulfocicer vacuolatum DSM 3385]
MTQKTFGKKLIEALTIDELIQLLDGLLSSMDKAHIRQMLSNLNNENIKEITSQLLLSDKVTKVVSDNKFLQKWQELWKSWDKYVSELGDEEGEYACQDNHWKAPYFDDTNFTENLENIAEKMLPFLDRISQMQYKETDLFKEALQEVESGIMDYPEWMGAEYSGCYFSEYVTECVVKWAWLNADSVETFLNDLIEIEDSFNIINLDEQGYINCFNELSEKVEKEIYDYITKNKNIPAWKERLHDKYCIWHQLYHNFSSRFDHTSYLETCRNMFHKNWEYGISLIEDCLDNDKLVEAEELSRQTINSFLGREAKKPWNPETSLLISELKSFYNSPNRSIIELMKTWMDITDKINMPSKVNALKLQIVTYENTYEWDKVVSVIEKIDNSSVSGLIEEWKVFCTHSANYQSKNYWVKCLMDATLDKNKNSSWFFKKIKEWLTTLSDNPKELMSQKTNLFALTFDIAELSDLMKKYPSLFKAIYHPLKENPQNPSILKWLKKTDGAALAPLLKIFWKKHLLNFLPDPVNVDKANYNAHAKWLAALKEANPKEYQTILTQWKKKHHRRRNLWKAIQEAGI